ncbi:VCBS protein, partial [Lachnospiraceae bacterium MD308]
KATYKITSMKGAVKRIAVSGKKSVKAGKTLKLKAKVSAAKKANKKVKWTSSNKKYATVSSSGKVKALKTGKGKKVKITAMATDGSGKKKTVVIKIK